MKRLLFFALLIATAMPALCQNQTPYSAQPINDMVVTEGFGSTTIDLNELFDDPDGDQLTFEVFVSSIHEEEERSVDAFVLNDKLIIEENSLGLSFIAISVSDGESFCETGVPVWVLDAGNKKPELQSRFVSIGFTTEYETAVIDLSDYVNDQDTVTYSLYFDETGSTITENVLEVNTSEAGLFPYYVIANDGKGGEEWLYIYAFVREPEAKAPQAIGQIPDMYIRIGETKLINVADYFSHNEPIDYFGVLNYDLTFLEWEEIGDEILFSPIGVGSAEVTVTALCGNGTFAQQTFTITAGTASSQEHEDLNTPPYIIQELSDLNLPKDFESYFIDLDDYFADNESDIVFSIEVATLTEEQIFANVSGSELNIRKDKNLSGSVAIIHITATDANGESVTSRFEVSTESCNVEDAEVFIINELPDLYLPKGFGTHTIYFKEYFESTCGEISYQCIHPYTYSISDTLYRDSLVIVEGNQPGITEITIYAYSLNSNNRVEQSFGVNYDGGTANEKPYIAHQQNDIILTEGFGTATLLNLSDMFADPDGDKLSFTVQSNDINDNEGSVTAFVDDDKLTVSENSTGLSIVFITASDGINKTMAVVFVSVLERGNKRPVAKANYAILDFAPNNEMASIDLSKYFTDQDQLTYTLWWDLSGDFVTGNILKVNISEVGLNSYYITADDGKGGEKEIIIIVSVHEQDALSPKIIAQIPDLHIDVNETKTIDFYDYFSTNETLEGFFLVDKDFEINVLDFNEADNKIILKSTGVGTTSVTVMALCKNGTHAEQTFTVTVGSPTPVLQIEESEVLVFPTVFSETLTVQGAGGSAISVYTMAGMPVFTLPVVSNDETLNLGQLAPGMYFLQVNGKTMPIIKE